ncbi:hypothetical protein ACEZCY_05430 [Streptacidiphilus sp. N1-12]|uniref:Uncharacterized protein n=2 Tax=Streptacidiphilus alkalitolerans TaxID=3342712 RepID=A0ABV6W9F0_9ACTN
MDLRQAVLVVALVLTPALVVLPFGPSPRGRFLRWAAAGSAASFWIGFGYYFGTGGNKDSLAVVTGASSAVFVGIVSYLLYRPMWSPDKGRGGTKSAEKDLHGLPSQADLIAAIAEALDNQAEAEAEAVEEDDFAFDVPVVPDGEDAEWSAARFDSALIRYLIRLGPPPDGLEGNAPADTGSNSGTVR